MLLHILGQRLKKDTAGLGKGVAKEDGVGQGGCVTTPPPFPPSRQLSPFPVFAMAVKVFSLCPTPCRVFTLGSINTILKQYFFNYCKKSKMEKLSKF